MGYNYKQMDNLAIQSNLKPSTRNQLSQRNNNPQCQPQNARSQKQKPLKPSYCTIKKCLDNKNMQLAQKLLQLNPKLLTQPKPSQNLLKYAIMSQNPTMLAFLFNFCHEKGKSTQVPAINDSIIDSIRFEKFAMFKVFVDNGFDVNTEVFRKQGLAMTSVDFAILGGHYDIAYFLYPRLNKQLKNLRNPKEYQIIGKKYQYRYVNYQMVVNGLINNVQPTCIGPYLKKQLTEKRKEQIRRIYQQGCWDWLMRVMGFVKKNKNKENEKKGKMVDSASSKNPNMDSKSQKRTVCQDINIIPPTQRPLN